MRFVLTMFLTVAAVGRAAAGDWPTYRADAARSGYTAEPLPGRLALQWSYHPLHGPEPAWPRDDRMTYDRAHHVAAAGGLVFFGGSADGKVFALDAATGETRWEFFTSGPVRFAPVVWQDKLFVVSDDGYLYCLGLTDGRLLRKWRGGPDDDLVLGNGRIVSKWPARGGPVIKDGVLYWGAGIWQSEGIFLRAMDPDTGEVVWLNDSSGGIEMAQPHGGANAKSGVSAQGYLAANDDQLFVPTGRAVPAAFARADGQFQFYHLQQNGHRGGTLAMTAGPFLYNGGSAFEAATGALSSARLTGTVCSFAGGIIHGTGDALRAYKPVIKDVPDRRGKPVPRPEHEALWDVDGVPSGSSLIVAGNTVVAGGGNTVTTVDLETQKPVWSAEVDAEALGLAVADGRLFVSTASGAVHCFGAVRLEQPRVHRAKPQDLPPVDDETARAAADEIIREAGVTEGYCLDLGCGDGGLTYELARRTDLYVVAVDPSAENVAAARKRLDDAGLYGTRAVVLQLDPKDTHLPKFFANLVVSGRSLTEGADVIDAAELERLQRPYGGVACIGPVREIVARTRGPLKGAGQWTHQYGDAANTLCSDDEVKGPLSVLWFRDVDLELPQRHGRGPSPLFQGGRLFVEGLDGLRAVDAYNGRSLWHYEVDDVLGAYNADHLAGTAITGSNVCLAGESVFLRHDDRCVRIDAATGRKLQEYRLPGTNDKDAEWGYIACVDGVLFGSVADRRHVVKHAYRPADELMKQQFSESDALFALDIESGELLWKYDAQHSIRHNAIAVGGGRVYLIDRPLATGDLLSRAVRRGEPQPAAIPQPTGELVVLDAKTGERRWDDNESVYGTTLVYSAEHDLLLMCYQPTRFKLPSEVGGRMRAYRADEGYPLWDKAVKYGTRPLINGRKIIAHPSAVDLLTGEAYPFAVAKSYGCGQVCGSKHLLMFRSGTLGYFDFTRDAGTENFGGIRPGCWINTLAVGGLVLVPDASAGCRCSYQNRAWIALEGAE